MFNSIRIRSFEALDHLGFVTLKPQLTSQMISLIVPAEGRFAKAKVLSSEKLFNLGNRDHEKIEKKLDKVNQVT